MLRAYLHDEPEHLPLREVLLESGESVFTSEIARVEFGSAVRRAREAGRATRWILGQFDADCSAGTVTLLTLRGESVLARAYDIVTEHPLRTLDAIHVAVALEELPDVFVTRDARQARVAAALGLAVG